MRPGEVTASAEKIIIDYYDLGSPLSGIAKHGSGHIHETCVVKLKNARRFLVQRFNHKVFPDIRAVHHNVSVVSKHIIQERISEAIIVLPVKTKENAWYCGDPAIGYWRIYPFIENSRSYDMPPNNRLAREAGRMFGEFLILLSGLSASAIKETIPDFHKMSYRIAQFEYARRIAAAERLKAAGPEIAFIDAYKEKMLELERRHSEGELKTRITHNDTKLNNVLFDPEDKGLCVIDLDTLMPGLVHYDFGDALRIIANHGTEDTGDLEVVKFDHKMFTAYTAGYLGVVAKILTPEEKESLYMGPKTMTFIMGLRFLTDFLSGDIYFNIGQADHNLLRTRTQLKFVEELEKNEDSIKEFIKQKLY